MLSLFRCVRATSVSKQILTPNTNASISCTSLDLRFCAPPLQTRAWFSTEAISLGILFVNGKNEWRGWGLMPGPCQ